MEPENKTKPNTEACKIVLLPHYVLRILLSYLDSTSLYLLSRTCHYLKEAVEDPVLWKFVDARKEPNTDKKIHYVIDKIHERTEHLLLRGYKKYTNVPQNLFDKISLFENLRVLALENIKLYGSKVSLKDFPTCLEELSLRRSYVKNSVYFFQHSAKRMHHLRVLILDECSWVTCSFLLSVSKFENLEIISAVKCLRAHMNMVPYLNVAKYGCKKLKILDFRFTGIGGELLRTFYSKHSIQRMYFQSYKSAQVDYDEKISSSAKLLSGSSVDMNSDLNITDNSLREYTSTTADSSIEPIAKSMLYQDPYPECKCGYKNSDQERTMPEPTIYSLEDDNDVYGPPAHTTAKFVCHKHMKDVEKLPSDFKDFFVIHQKQFHSDITSDIDDSDDSDSSGGSDDNACCIYAMGTKMVILPNVHEPNNRSEMDLPSRDGSSRNFVPFNIFIVNPFDARNNRQVQNAGSSRANNQAGPSGTGCITNSTAAVGVQNAPMNNDYGECSTVNKVFCEKRKHDDSDSDTDDESDNKKRKIGNDTESSDEMVDGKESEKKECNCTCSDKSKDSKQENEDASMDETSDETDDSSDTNKQDQTESDTDDETGENCENANKVPIKSAKDDGNKPKCRRIIQPDKYATDSDSEAEEDKEATRMERLKRGRSFSTDRHGKKKCSESGGSRSGAEKKVDMPREAVHNRRLSNFNEWHAEHPWNCGRSFDQGRPSTSRIRSLSAERAEPDEEKPVVKKTRETPANLGRPRRRPWRCPSPVTFELDRRQHPPMQAHVRLEGWVISNKKISLRRISLRGYQKITHLALLYLRYLQIELIDLTYTSVTKREIENFLLYNPNCRVIHPMYCVCKPRNPF